MAAGRAADGRGSKDAPTAARRERSSASAPAGAPGRGRRLAGRPRPVIEAVRPQVEGGRYPAKASLGELVVVEADVFADGHDELFVELTHRPGDHGAGAAFTGAGAAGSWLRSHPSNASRSTTSQRPRFTL